MDAPRYKPFENEKYARKIKISSILAKFDKRMWAMNNQFLPSQESYQNFSDKTAQLSSNESKIQQKYNTVIAITLLVEVLVTIE